MPLHKTSLAALVLGGTMLLAACGGGDSATAPAARVATANTSVAVNPTTGAAVVAAVLNETFSFASGVPAFDTSSATSLTLTGSPAAPSFAMSSGSNTASGVMTYGSCIFEVRESTFPIGHPMTVGNKFTVALCTLAVATSGVTANGGSSESTVSLVLDTATSSTVPATVSVSSAGVVSVDGLIVGFTTVSDISGASN